MTSNNYFCAGWLTALIFGLSAQARPNKTNAIDNFCVAVRHEFVEAAPRYFSGPNPWVQLAKLPEAFADAAVASVYSEGPRVTWVVLEMAGPGNKWFETTHYFFDKTGLIKKRERHFEYADANIVIDEGIYFARGKIIKTNYHHGPLNEGKENRDEWYDPNAPRYASTADLPVSFSATDLKELAGLETVTMNPLYFMDSAVHPTVESIFVKFKFDYETGAGWRG